MLKGFKIMYIWCVLTHNKVKEEIIVKKFFISIFTIFLIVTFFACGTATPNSSMSDKINYTLDNMTNNLKEVQSINENDILINEISSSDVSTYTSIAVNPRRGTHATRQIIDYTNQGNVTEYGYSNTNAMRNVNSYNPYGKLHNVNSYQGLNQYGPNQINEINQAQYGNPYGNAYGYGAGYPGYNYPANGAIPYQGAMPYNGAYNGINRGISNVNTYGLSKTNVNTYRPQLVNQTDDPVQENIVQNNVDTYQNQQSTTEDYNQYATSENLKNQFTQLSNLYSVASNVVSVNKAINQEKLYINACVDQIKLLTARLKTLDTLFNADQERSINFLLENINSYISKIKLSKNEVRYELDKVKELKNSYQNNSQLLTSRYVRLTNCLDTRYSYYCNVSSCLEQLITYLQNFVNQTEISNSQVHDLTNNTNQQIVEIPQENIIPNQTDNTAQNQKSGMITDQNKTMNEQQVITPQTSENTNQEQTQNSTQIENMTKRQENTDTTNQNATDRISINELIRQRRLARVEKQTIPEPSQSRQVQEENKTEQNQDIQQSLQDEKASRNIIKQNFNPIPTPSQEVLTEEKQPSIEQVNHENLPQELKPVKHINFYKNQHSTQPSQTAMINPFKDPKKHDFIAFTPKVKQMQKIEDETAKQNPLKQPKISITKKNTSFLTITFNNKELFSA